MESERQRGNRVDKVPDKHKGHPNSLRLTESCPCYVKQPSFCIDTIPLQ